MELFCVLMYYIHTYIKTKKNIVTKRNKMAIVSWSGSRWIWRNTERDAGINARSDISRFHTFAHTRLPVHLQTCFFSGGRRKTGEPRQTRGEHDDQLCKARTSGMFLTLSI